MNTTLKGNAGLTTLLKNNKVMNQLYVLVQWPESQMLMDNPHFNECLFVDYLERHNDPGSSAYMCPKELYDEIFK